jgi:UDP-N-acetylglucosamine:LPS N-acetylglucosamine transferase
VAFEHKSKLRICLAASAGGHISQLLKLSNSWNGRNTFCVTTTQVIVEHIKKYGNVYVVGECNYKHPLRVIVTLIRCLKVVVRERPDVIISTGAAAGCIMCFLGKLFGARIVWIDSITNVERMSLSGRLVRPVADLFLVQWPQLAEKYSNVEYAGTLI